MVSLLVVVFGALMARDGGGANDCGRAVVDNAADSDDVEEVELRCEGVDGSLTSSARSTGSVPLWLCVGFTWSKEQSWVQERMRCSNSVIMLWR